MAVDLVPVRHRRETVREQNLRLELFEARRDALAVCDQLERHLRPLYAACRDVDVRAEQLAAGAMYAVSRYRARQGT